MIRKIVSFFGCAIISGAFASMTGCDGQARAGRDPAPGMVEPRATPTAFGDLDGVALRVKTDTARGRIWVLDDDRVRVYRAADRRLIREVMLPDALVSAGACTPDLALDRAGSVFVSSNVAPKIWRIDGDTLRVTTHEVSLGDKQHWDTGFGALAFDHAGALYALGSSWGAVWKIDFPARSAVAIHVGAPPAAQCAFTPGFLLDFESAAQPWSREPFVLWRGNASHGR